MSESQLRSNRSAGSIGLLFLTAFIAYGYNNAFMTISPLVAYELGGTMVEAGLQGTVFLACAIVLRFFFGPLADRIGVKFVMILGLGAFVLSALLFSICSDFWQMLAVRCVQAIGLSAFFPCATAAVSYLSPEKRIGAFMGMYRFVTSLSLLVAPAVFYALMQKSGFATCSLVLAVLSAFALGIVVFIPLNKEGGTVRALGKKKYGQEGLADETCFGEETTIVCDNPLKGHSNPVRRLSGYSGLVSFVLAVTLLAAWNYGLLFGFAALYVDSVQPSANSGFYFTLVGIGGLVANPLIGWIVDKASQKHVAVFCLGCLGLGVAVLFWLPNVGAVLYVSGVLAGFGYAGAITSVISLVSVRVDKSCRTTVLSIQQTGIDLGIACASGVFGFIFTIASSMSLVFAVEGLLTLGIVAIPVVYLFVKQFQT